MSISDSILSGNTAAHEGGAIASGGLLTITNSTLSGNSSGRSGGAIATSAGTLTLNGCTLTDNTAQDGGGAVFVDPTVVTIIACVFSGNSAPVGADLYNLDSDVTIIGSSGDFFNSGGTVIDPIADLLAHVAALNLSRGQTNSLTSSLYAAQQSLANGNTTAAVNQLNAFINKVNALVNSGRLGQLEASSLIEEVENLIDVLA
jgi:predicted outer membrane repeat protein